ncbi:hypothetical protein ACIRRA_41850, partial [Nocardia sp. NPDC101769]|uniref:hypothetical protein n=1 Tax=Nocardia sp. NPDC101769 TaxID=3364333 RepID=UPI00381D3A1D
AVQDQNTGDMIDHQAPVGNPGRVNHANRARSRIGVLLTIGPLTFGTPPWSAGDDLRPLIFRENQLGCTERSAAKRVRTRLRQVPLPLIEAGENADRLSCNIICNWPTYGQPH